MLSARFNGDGLESWPKKLRGGTGARMVRAPAFTLLWNTSARVGAPHFARSD